MVSQGGGSFPGTCLQSLGRDASGRSSSNASETKRTCLLGGNFFERSNCVIDAVKDFISYFHLTNRRRSFARHSKTPNSSRRAAFTSASYYAQF